MKQHQGCKIFRSHQGRKTAGITWHGILSLHGREAQAGCVSRIPLQAQTCLINLALPRGFLCYQHLWIEHRHPVPPLLPAGRMASWRKERPTPQTWRFLDLPWPQKLHQQGWVPGRSLETLPWALPNLFLDKAWEDYPFIGHSAQNSSSVVPIVETPCDN